MSSYVNHSRFVRQPVHPDIAYIKESALGLILGKSLSDLYSSDPQKPLDFLGNWLINRSEMQANLELHRERAAEREELREKHRLNLQHQAEMAEEAEKRSAEEAQTEQNLRFVLENSFDIEDHLEEVLNFIESRLGASGVYLGRYERLKKKVGDLDDEFAHIDTSAPFVIKYTVTSKKAADILHKVLREEEGEATYSVWKAEDEEAEEQKLRKYVFVKDVVNDPRIKFFDVPKLGSYLVIPLTYLSCQSESTFDAAVENALECRRLRAEREQELLQKQAEEENSKAEEDKEPVEEEPLPEIKEAPYATSEVKFVFCCDSLGQDRVFSQAEVEYTYEWVQFLVSQWQRAENACMASDVASHIQQTATDKQIASEKAAEWAEEERFALEETATDPEASDEARTIVFQSALLNVLRSRLLEQTSFASLLALKNYSILKYSQLFMIAFMYFRIPKENIVEEGTNKIYWKAAKKHLDESLADLINEVQPCGPQPGEVPVYAKTIKLQRDLTSLPYEEIKDYNIAMGHLYKFLETAFKIRVMDVTNRRNEYLAKKEAHATALKAAEDLAQARKQALDDAIEKHKAEMAQVEEDEKEEFNEEKFLVDFDSQDAHQPVHIPEEPALDEDNDIDWRDTNP